MKQFLANLFYLFLSCTLIISCGGKFEFEKQGRKPIYLSYDNLFQYNQTVPQPIQNSGKILLYGNYLFMIEVNKGVHVIDISDTANPQKMSFLNIPGNKDITSQSNFLYADNGPDLLVLDLTDINNIKLITRQKSVFKPSEFYPSGFIGFFECADYAKGWVVAWETALLQNPECRRE